MAPICKSILPTLYALGLLLICAAPVNAQRGLYLSGGAGMAYQLFETQPALRIDGEMKWMFLPYLGVSLDGAMQRPPVRSRAMALSAMIASCEANSEYYTYDDITASIHFSFVLQPIAIVKKDTPHLFSVKLGVGGSAFQSESWQFRTSSDPTAKANNSYLYDEYYYLTVGLELGYSYQIFGPLYLGSRLGLLVLPDILSPFYVYAAFTAGIRFARLSSKTEVSM